MDMPAITKQMIELQKTVFVNTYDRLAVLQDYSQNMMHSCMKRAPWISEENMKPFEDSMEFIKKVREDYKHAVDKGFVMLEEMARAPKAAVSPAKVKAAPRSSAQSGSTLKEAVKKASAPRGKTVAPQKKSAAAKNKKTTSAPKSRAAVTGTAKKTVSSAKTAASKQQPAAQSAKSAAEK